MNRESKSCDLSVGKLRAASQDVACCNPKIKKLRVKTLRAVVECCDLSVGKFQDGNQDVPSQEFSC